MDQAERIKKLRESMGMNRKEFCEHFDIPYRTVTEWERDGRHAPDYVIRLLVFLFEIIQTYRAVRNSWIYGISDREI